MAVKSTLSLFGGPYAGYRDECAKDLGPSVNPHRPKDKGHMEIRGWLPLHSPRVYMSLFFHGWIRISEERDNGQYTNADAHARSCMCKNTRSVHVGTLLGPIKSIYGWVFIRSLKKT